MLVMLIFNLAEYKDGTIVSLEVFNYFSIMVLPVIFIMKKYKDKSQVTKAGLNLNRNDYGFLILLLIAELIMFFGFIYYIADTSTDLESTHFITDFIAACIFAPISEELLFRGVILGGLAKRYNAKTAILVSGILFGFGHLGIARSIATSISGIILGYVYYYTNSLKPVIFMHFCWNLLVTVIDGFPIFYPNNSLLAIIVSIIYILVGLGLIYLVIKKLNLRNRALNSSESICILSE